MRSIIIIIYITPQPQYNNNFPKGKSMLFGCIYTAAKNNKIIVLGTRYRPGATASRASTSDSL